MQGPNGCRVATVPFCPRWRGGCRVATGGGRQSARARCRLRATPYWTLSGVRVYLGNVAPLAQRLEQRPFKSWVVGSNPTGGTCETLGNIRFQGFFNSRDFLAPDAISRTHIVRTPNTDCHIIIRAGKHPAVAIIGFLTLTGKTPCRDGALPIPKGFRQYSGNRKVGNREKIAIPTNTP